VEGIMRVQEYTFYMIWDPEERVWVTHVPDLNNLSTFGETKEEAIAMTREAIELYLEVAREKGRPLPEPSSQFGKIAVSIS